MIRLAALADSPDAFATTHEEASAYADAVWADRAAEGAHGEDQATFLAFDAGGTAVGLVVGLTDSEDASGSHLVSLWVHPDARGKGLASKLTAEVIDWSVSSGFRHLRLWVTETNTAARTLYESLGFNDTGERQPLPSNPDLAELLLQIDPRER